MNARLNVKHAATFITTITLALLVVACGADKAEEMTPESPAPVALAEAPQPPESRPDPGEQGQGPGFEGGARAGGAMGFMAIISEVTGLSIEELREEAAAGATMEEIIAAHGGDVEAVRAQLFEAMSDMPNVDETDLERRVSDLLNNPLPGPRVEGAPGRSSEDQ
jgi:hypothetical protein